MKKTTLVIWSILQFCLLATLLNGQITDEEKMLKRKIDSYLKAGVNNGFSGSILVAKKGKIILHEGYGMADKENNIPYTTSTVSTIGSVTKQFTATAILKLVAFKQLKTTDPISKFFKNLPKDKKDITIHQLLTHSAGLIPSIGDGDFDDLSRKRFFKTLFATKLLHQPGSKYSYSNAGYSLLARIIEIVSGKEYESFLKEHLFKPAGMNNTGYLLPKWEENLIAQGYARNFVSMGNLISRYQKMGKITWALKGNGGIHATTGDMFKWYKALKSNKILSKQLFKKLTTSYIPENETETIHYAYGWSIYDTNRNTKIISHNGGNEVFFHDFIWSYEEDLVIILFTNAGSREVEVAWPIEQLLFDKSYQIPPIKRDLFYLVFDFIKQHDLREANKLINTIKEAYISSIKSSSELNNIGYRILKNEIIDLEESTAWAIRIFKLNTELFPKNGNIWDSLGEAYLNDGQKEEAIRCYKKALQLAPNRNCDWCKSSTNALKKLSQSKK